MKHIATLALLVALVATGCTVNIGRAAELDTSNPDEIAYALYCVTVLSVQEAYATDPDLWYENMPDALEVIQATDQGLWDACTLAMKTIHDNLDSPATGSITNGQWFVGSEVEPGTYRSDGWNGNGVWCTWEAYNSVGDIQEIEFSNDGSIIMVVKSEYDYINISDCHPFEKVK